MVPVVARRQLLLSPIPIQWDSVDNTCIISIPRYENLGATLSNTNTLETPLNILVFYKASNGP